MLDKPAHPDSATIAASAHTSAAAARQAHERARPETSIVVTLTLPSFSFRRHHVSASVRPLYASPRPADRAGRPRASAPLDGIAEQAERRRAQDHHRAVEPMQREPGAPLLAGPLTESEDLQLAPRVAAVGGVERRAAGL